MSAAVSAALAILTISGPSWLDANPPADPLSGELAKPFHAICYRPYANPQGSTAWPPKIRSRGSSKM
jgi:hypothetical protein